MESDFDLFDHLLNAPVDSPTPDPAGDASDPPDPADGNEAAAEAAKPGPADPGAADDWALDEGWVSDISWPPPDDAASSTEVVADRPDPSPAATVADAAAGADAGAGADVEGDIDVEADVDQLGWTNPASDIFDQSDGTFDAEAGLAPPALMALLDAPVQDEAEQEALDAYLRRQPTSADGPSGDLPLDVSYDAAPGEPGPGGGNGSTAPTAELWSETGTPGWLDEGEDDANGVDEGTDNLIHLARPWSEPETPSATGQDTAMSFDDREWSASGLSLAPSPPSDGPVESDGFAVPTWAPPAPDAVPYDLPAPEARVIPLRPHGAGPLNDVGPAATAATDLVTADPDGPGEPRPLEAAAAAPAAGAPEPTPVVSRFAAGLEDDLLPVRRRRR